MTDLELRVAFAGSAAELAVQRNPRAQTLVLKEAGTKPKVMVEVT